MKIICLILLLLPVTASAFEDWYQIEVIVFAQRNPQITNEQWQLQPLKYPANMLTLATADGSNLRPLNLSQLKSLMAWEAMMGGSLTGSPAPGRADTEFLFEDRSRFSGTRMPDELRTGSGSNKDEDLSTVDTQPADLNDILYPDEPQAFELVPTGDRVLSRLAGSINRSSRYRLLSHLAWRQPVTATGDAFPILVQAGDRVDDMYELDGTLTVSRARFLHVQTNLWFTEFTKKYEQELPMPDIVAEFSPGTLREYPDLVAVERTRGNYVPVQSHHMDISRRMRSATLHYLDHPYFGVLVQIEQFSYQSETEPELAPNSPPE